MDLDRTTGSSPTRADLVDVANAARANAYAPYSDFGMGAAVRTDDGTIVPGSLVENVSLGLAMCAERSALFATVAAASGRPVELVLVAPRTAGRVTLPCGACLQVALELGGPSLVVTGVDPDGVAETHVLADLLPRAPSKHHLGDEP